MAYTRENHLRQVQYMMSVYKQVKEADIPDTRIVSKIFPRYNIFISYRQWMNIKGMKPSEYNGQLSFSFEA